MSTWLKLLPLELDSIDANSFVDPGYELEPGDSTMGTMPKIAQQLYTLGSALERDAKQSVLDAEYCKNESDRDELVVKAMELAEKASALKQIMWISIRDEFHVWSSSIGIRKDFMVVKTAEHNDMPPFLRRLFGGGQ